MVGLDIYVAIKTDQFKKEEVVAEEVKSWREKKMHGKCLKDLEQLDLWSMEMTREDNYRSHCSKLAWKE